MFTAFYETRNLMRSYTGYIKPLSYDEWTNVPDNQKSAVLFVQFFNPIVKAWEKANNFGFIPSEDGVSVVLQYLEKNVSVILNDPKRFTPQYIYRVAYNCMYCICHDLQRVKDMWEHEVPNIVSSDGEELDLFDTVVSDSDASKEAFSSLLSKNFWSVLGDIDKKTEKILNYLLSKDPKDLKKKSKRAKDYAADPLRDIEVSLDEVEAKVEELKEKLSTLYFEMNNN